MARRFNDGGAALTDQVSWGDVAGIDGATKLTWSFWMNIHANVLNQRIMGKFIGVGTLGFEFAFTGSSVVDFYFLNGSFRSARVNPHPATDEWHHYLVIYDGTQATNALKVRIYIDGVQETLAFPLGDIPTSIGDSGANPLTIGDGFEAPADSGQFSMAELLIWAGAAVLPSSTIRRGCGNLVAPSFIVLDAGLSPAGSPGDFPEIDRSQFAHTGTITGTTAVDHPAAVVARGSCLTVHRHRLSTLGRYERRLTG